MWDKVGNLFCDLCDTECTQDYYDAYIPGVGCWGYTCPTCFVRCHCRLGLGLGQHFINRKKVEG